MKSLTRITGTSLVVLMVFISVVHTACKKDKDTSSGACAGIVCQNNGVCISGICDCTAGYTGEFCQDKAISPYLGKWAVTEEVISSNGQPVSGDKKNYEMTISEDPSGVTIFNISDFAGEPGFDNVRGRIAMTIGEERNSNGALVETEMPAEPSSFVFIRYQPLGQSTKQLVKGEGSINSLGTSLSGEYYIVYPDSAKGAVEDRISFSATYLN